MSAKKSRPTAPRIEETSMSDLWNMWYSELHEQKIGLTQKVNRVLESYDSPFQRIEIFDTAHLGKTLVLYGSLMVAEGDENAYNEMLAHPALFAHPNPKDVLIVGGGDCGCLTNVLKHPEVEQCVMCEIDKEVVEVSKRHFPKLTAGVKDKRAKLVFADGKKYLEETNRKFDVILLDLSDPIGPAVELFQKSFHQLVFDRLKDDGIMVAQSESPFYHRETVRNMYSHLREIFPIVEMYLAHMIIYPSSLWSFAYCSKEYHPHRNFDQPRYNKLAPGMANSYYNDEIHRGSFALPQYVKELIGKS